MSDRTIYVTIGNSDDGLTQAEWADFYAAVDHAIRSYASRVYGAWTSVSTSPYQNACWAFSPTQGFGEDGTSTASLRERLSGLAVAYRQDSIAWVEGESDFVTPPQEPSKDRCRCGKMKSEASPYCTWHKARAHRAGVRDLTPVVCPIHAQTDCSPMLNGCSLVIQWVEAASHIGQEIKDDRPQQFRSGQWGRVERLVWFPTDGDRIGRWGYAIRWQPVDDSDHLDLTDKWVTTDDAGYEFRD